MEHSITFPKNNVKYLNFQFNFNLSNLNSITNQITLHIIPANLSIPPYEIAPLKKTIFNQIFIILEFNLTQELYGNETLLIQTISQPQSTQGTYYHKTNYSIAALPSLVCDLKCSPESTTVISTQQTAVNSVSTVFTAAASLMNGMNLGDIII